MPKWGEIKQLDYVKQYFKLSKNKIKSPEDIYLHVFAPKGVGKPDDYVLYDKKYDGEKYNQNKSVDNENNADGKIQRSEILGRFYDSKNKGKTNKADKFICGSSKDELNEDFEDIITYHIYANGEIEKHIPKKIKSGYEKKYRYVYHDKLDNLHDLGTYDIIPTQMYGGKKRSQD